MASDDVEAVGKAWAHAADLNPQQREAVEHDSGALLILAGAGSGKTRVITHRIARLIDVGVPPWRILAVTFTNRAAREMRERVAHLVEEDVEGLEISTFHSACARWLRRHARRVGLTPGFSIYDNDDQIALIRATAERLRLPHDASAAREMRRRIDRAKNEALRTDEVESRARGPEGERFALLYRAYQHALEAANACDFGDLIAKMVHLLEDAEDVRAAFRQRLEHVMVDEFQDTNGAQYRLISALAPDSERGSVVVVGDDDQSIYRWRGATVDNVARFEVDFDGCRVIKLEQNYRSTEPILEAAHAVVAPLPERLPKKLWTARTGGSTPQIFVGRSDREEAEFVARVIRERRIDRGLSWSDFAVFYRTNAQSRILEEVLRGAGVAHEVIGGQSFFERREVKDLLAYLRLAANPADDVAFRRVVNVPSRGVGAITLGRIEKHRDQGGFSSLREALRHFGEREMRGIRRTTKAGLREFSELLDRLAEQAERAQPASLVASILAETDYVAWLTGQSGDDTDDRVRNIDELRNAAFEFGALHAEASTLDFLEYTALRQAQDELDADDGGAADLSKVHLMTVHAAKGLEFDTVLVTGLEDGLFPLSRRGQTPDAEQAAEERRLCYVAVTRAKEGLYLTAALTRRLHGPLRETRPSPFLAELSSAGAALDDRSAVRSVQWGRDRRFGDATTSAPDAPAPPPSDEFDFDQRPWHERQSPQIDVPAEGIVFGDEFFPEERVASARSDVGRTVSHNTFGEGTVVDAEISGDRVRLQIDFPDVGLKSVIRKYVTFVD